MNSQQELVMSGIFASSQEQKVLLSRQKEWSQLSEQEQETKKKQVLDATKEGDLNRVEQLILKYNFLKYSSYEHQGYKLQDCTLVADRDNADHRDNPLHLAALHGHLQIVKYFIKKRFIESECRNRYKNTPLHRAAREGQLEVIKYLIEEQHCDRMCTCNWGRTPLHIACRHTHLEVVKYLMDLQGVDVNAKDERYRSTPLDLAAAYGSVGLVRYMIEDKNCYDPANYKGSNTPLHFAAYRGNRHVVEYLVANRGFDVNIKGTNNGTPLHSACRAGHLEVVKYLMDTKLIIDDYGEGKTPLEVAVEHGTLEVVQYLIDERHCHLKFTSKDGYTLLHRAACCGKMDIVQYLIETKGFKPDCKGLKGRTPLHSACLGGKYDVVDYLIYELNVKPLSPDDDGSTPLHSAVKSGKKSVIELIITEFDSELEVIDKHGRDAATIAMEKSYTAEISGYLNNVKKLRQNQWRNSLKTSLKVTKAIPTGEVIASGNIIELKILTTGEKVAGKVLEIDRADTTKLMNKPESFKQNVNTLMNFSNENIVGIKGVSFLPDRILPVLLMERMISNLDSYIKNHPFSSLLQRIEMLCDIARGLHYLHSLNPPFIHGHLTTDNVLLDLGLKAKIGGFAIASTSRRPIKTQYMPPEAQGGIELSNPNVDIFSFGHLALCTVVREEVGPLLPSQYNEAGKPRVLYEVDRRASSMKNAEGILSEQKSIFQAIKECLSNDPSKRPSAKKLLNMLEADGSKGESKDKDIMEGTSEEDRRLYGDAMTKGYVESAFALLILLGVTGSGKSLFKRLVLGLPVPEFSPSTPLAESTIRSMSISTVAVNEGCFKWVIVGPQNMIELVAKEIKTGLKPQNTTKSVSDKDEFRKQFVSESNGAGKMERENNAALLKQKCEVPTDPKKQSKVLQQKSAVRETTHNARSKPLSEKFLDALKGIKIDSDLMTNSSKDVPQKLMDINFMYLLDSGGQPPFREMLPHFVQQSSAMVLMQKLNERLDFRPTIRYRDKEGKVSEGYTSELTNEQILYQYVQAAQSQKSKVFVVGTHRDMEGECKDETREKKNEKLFEAFRPVIGKQMELYKVGNPDQLMFPVDSTSRGPDDEAIAEEFRKKVTTSCMGEKVKIPLPWFVLEQLLQLLAQKMQVRVLSINECYEAAKRKLLMPYDAFEAGLTYLGKLNLIFYFPSILPGVVFSDAQVILDKITELVRCNHALRTYDSSSDAIPSCMQSNEMLELRELGQVNSKLLKKAFPSHYRDHLFTSSDFLKLLEGLMIAGKLENGEYFIPSLLPNLPDENIANYRVTLEKNPAPLVIYYPKMWVPVGIMPTLTVYLRNTCKWVLARGKPACLYHNCIQFMLLDGKPGSVVLIDSTKFLEIHILQTLEVDQKLCTKIGQDIMVGLKEAHKSLYYDSAEAMMGFLCSGECGNKEAHLATLDPTREAWLCSENVHKGNYLNERQKYWDGALKITTKGTEPHEEKQAPRKPGTTNSLLSISGENPTMPKLVKMKVPSQVGPKIKQFGIILLQDDGGNKVSNIARKCQENPEEMAMEVLMEWLSGNGKEVSWESLIATLRDCELNVFAKRLQIVLDQQKS